MSTGPNLSSRHRRTLERIFEHPVPPNIHWRDVISLFEALGATVTQRRGSRVSVSLGGSMQTFHEPHPQRLTNRGAVAAVRIFLETEGIRP
jgi:hypothetical protein